MLLAGLVCVLIPGASAQPKPASSGPPEQAQTASAIPVDAGLVNLPVVVRDKKGVLLQNLTKDDFTLQVDGKPQTVRYFGQDANLPLSVGLVVDTSLSQKNVIEDERAASSAFLDQMLATAKDKGFVAQFSRQTELLQDLTASHPLLQAALKELDTSGSSAGSAPDTRSPNTTSAGGHHGGATLYDALFLTSDEIMRKQAGRKAIILLSDGVDSGSKETLAEAIEAAQRADTVLYAIYLRGESHPMNGNPRSNNGGYPGGGYPGGGYPGGGYPGGGYPGGGYPGGGYPGGGYPGGGYPGGSSPGGGNSGGTSGRSNVDGRKVLERMAQETGGRVFEAKRGQDIARIYDQIAEELRAQHRLGYTPTQDAAAGGYHKVDLTAKQKGLLVQTRDGYYTGK